MMFNVKNQQFDAYFMPTGSAGKGEGAGDPRAGTLRNVVDYIQMSQPTCFVLENVPAIRSKKHRHSDSDCNLQVKIRMPSSFWTIELFKLDGHIDVQDSTLTCSI